MFVREQIEWPLRRAFSNEGKDKTNIMSDEIKGVDPDATRVDGKLKYKFDTQLLISGENLDEMEVRKYITEHFDGDCLLAVGDDELIKIHFHTNEPWKVLEYGQSIGDIYDIVVENMQRQEDGLKG